MNQQPIGAVVENIAIGVEGLSSITGKVKLHTVLSRFATATTFLRSCVVQAPSHAGEPHHSLHASMYRYCLYCREYNEDGFF